MLFDIVKTHQSPWLQCLLLRCLITVTGGGCVRAVAKLSSRGEEN